MTNPSLESIDWSQLRGPYGPSDKVPKLIAQLRAAYDRETAWELHWTIIHKARST